ncbi:Disease resistance protein rpp13 [Thalictrum thalictroides]|uniref:Disease resistance protein rpp13 n=1 Tax=Thalictrum thalictroides TaxID=46969 RepID=A0A7J6WTK0_THATH|nr:Disease resistance protein rpp13 [Thalictrum thalictroides]
MADVIVSPLVEQLTKMITTEAHLLLGVGDQIISLRNQLEWIRCFLTDAEKKSKDIKVVEIWVRQVRELAYDAEDIIDAFNLHVERRKNAKIMWRIIGFWNKLWTLHRTGTLIEQFNKRSTEISTYRSQYNIHESISMQDSSHRTERLVSRLASRQTTPLVEEQVIVGFAEEATQLAAWLVKDEKEPRRRVMSIIGMGGLGKTTLAKLVYGKREVENHFDVRAWIYVSTKYRVRDLLSSCLKQVRGAITIDERSHIEKMDDGELKIELHKHLQGKRYLVVIDNIWNVDTWGRISASLPENQNGSRVLITTRNKDVAIHADQSTQHHDLRLMNKDESWELFCAKVFSSSEAKTIRFLDILGNKMHPVSAKPRRLGVHSCDTSTDANHSSTSFSKLRSILFFDVDFQIGMWKSTFGGRTRMLRVLDLEGVNLSGGLPQQIWKLIFLHYLGLRNCFSVEFPPSIGNLARLQTLDVRNTLLRSLTKEIWKLKQLRHLYMNSIGVIGSDFTEDLPRNLISLEISSDLWNCMWQATVKFGCLQSLTLNGELHCPNKSLRNFFPLSILELHLEESVLEEDPSSVLGSLPALKELRLRNKSYTGKKLLFLPEGFFQLELLELRGLQGLEEWTVEDEAMSSLRHLVIYECPGLKMLPDGLIKVTTLQKIEISNMPNEFLDRVKANGKDWDKIKDVPFIICN